MTAINHEFYVSLEVAKLLKEAGFDWEIYDGYIIYENGDGFTTEFQTLHNFNGDNGDLFINYREHKEVLSRPTLDVAKRWLREVKNMSVEVLFEKPGKWSCCVILDTDKRISFENFWREEFDYDTYEQSQEAGIKKALELILEK